MQQGLQEPQHAGTAAPQCKRAAEDSEPATKLGIVAGAQGAQLHRGWASGCAPHRAVDASAKPRPRSEDLRTPRGCAGQQHSLPASCSPVVTDPEHPALAPSTRLALTQPGTQPGMQRPRPARSRIPLLAPARRGPGLTLHARLPLRPNRPACPACGALGKLYDKMSARPGLDLCSAGPTYRIVSPLPATQWPKSGLAALPCRLRARKSAAALRGCRHASAGSSKLTPLLRLC